MKNQNLKIGSFVKGSYKLGSIEGTVEKICTSHVVIQIYSLIDNKLEPINLKKNLLFININEIN